MGTLDNGTQKLTYDYKQEGRSDGFNSLNYKHMRGYLKFVHKFPNIFYAEFNLIKVLGYVESRKYLVPRISVIAPYFLKALEYSKKVCLRVIVDGMPLCYMSGFEELNIDTFKFINRGYDRLVEKTKTRRCKRCTLKQVCGGVRTDYIKVFGDEELTPSSKDPSEVIKKVAIRK